MLDFFPRMGSPDPPAVPDVAMSDVDPEPAPPAPNDFGGGDRDASSTTKKTS